MKSDVERNQLYAREKELNERQQTIDEADTAQLQAIVKELGDIHKGWSRSGTYSLKQGTSILSGLQFTDEMQSSSTRHYREDGE